MKFEEGAKLYSYSVQREGGEDVIYINYQGASYVPSIIDYPEVMERTMDALIENPNVSRIVLVQQRNYNYDFNEVKKLAEIANLYNFLIKQERVLSIERFGNNQEEVSKRYSFMSFFMQLFKSDPVASYFKIKNSLVEGKEKDSYHYLLRKKIFQII